MLADHSGPIIISVILGVDKLTRELGFFQIAQLVKCCPIVSHCLRQNFEKNSPLLAVMFVSFGSKIFQNFILSFSHFRDVFVLTFKCCNRLSLRYRDDL